jgi:hypothetical protein
MRLASSFLIVIVLLLFSLTKEAPSEDEMHLTITGYAGHKWYSGKHHYIKAI